MVGKKGELIELTISDFAFGVKGLAKVNGLVVFVEHAVPLDRLVARIVKKKKNYVLARIDTLIDPSPFRIEPPCRYSGYCGGCKWLFLNYEKQLEYKRRHVTDSLEHIGLIKDVPVHPTIPSERIFGYRNKMEFSCSDRRWLLPEELGNKDIDINFALGLHVPGSFSKVVDIAECRLQPELGNRILDDIRSYIIKSGVPVYGLRSHKGFWRYVMLRHSMARDQWMVNIISSAEDRKILQPLADQLKDTYPQIVSIVNNITAKNAGIAVGEYEILLAGTSYLRDKIGPFKFDISANSFFQTNTRGATGLSEIVRKYAELAGIETIVDLYSGIGTIAICLANSAKEVIGMEILENAVTDARKNSRLNGISNCSFIQGDIKESLSLVKKRPDVMVIDPPRMGMHKNVIKLVLDMAPQRIVYVSCNPATLARDLGLIKEKYHVLEIQPIDMFPHTYHIESVVKLQRKNVVLVQPEGVKTGEAMHGKTKD